MKKIKFKILTSALFSVLICLCSCTEVKQRMSTGNLKIGWSTIYLTPDRTVLVSGQFHARVSEGIMDPITATALALESGTGPSSEKVIMISCDLSTIKDGSRNGNNENLRNNVRDLLVRSFPELKPEQIILNATHTHSGPYYGVEKNIAEYYGIELDAMSPLEVNEFLTDRISKVATKAWQNRKAGGISYGLGHAMVGQNRLQVDLSGKSQMYGNTNRPEFSHIEGYEDHSVNLLYTWDSKSKLTGVVINVACPSQVSESVFRISADYWHDVRVELGERLGQDIFVLPQISFAGDQSPHIMVGSKAEERMQKLMFPDEGSGRGSIGRRKQIAMHIADAVTSVLPYVKDNIEWSPIVVHKMEEVQLSRRLISIEDVDEAMAESEKWKIQYGQLLQEIESNPEIKEKPRWYTDVTSAYTRTRRGQNVKDRYELEKIQPKMPTEVHVIRIGDVVMATNQFEHYLDYGIRIKARSPAVQTFLIQIAGWSTYLPTPRSIAGGTYGAVPASTLIGPEGGEELVENTLELIQSVWEKE